MARKSQNPTHVRTQPSDRRLTVYHDGACPLCRAEIAFYRRRGAAARFIDIADHTSEPPPGVNRDRALGRFHVQAADGRVMSGAAAFAALWRVTPGWRTLGRIGGAPPFVWIGEALYRLFLPVRPLLQTLARRLPR